jgi:hypothetical protein
VLRLYPLLEEGRGAAGPHARFRMGEQMLRRIMTVVLLTGLLGLGSAATAMAAANPSPTGTGPPNQSCQAFETVGTGAGAPGNSGTSPGSVFNEPGFGSQNGGTGGNAYNAAGAPSQYDVACFQVNQPHP